MAKRLKLPLLLLLWASFAFVVATPAKVSASPHCSTTNTTGHYEYNVQYGNSSSFCGPSTYCAIGWQYCTWDCDDNATPTNVYCGSPTWCVCDPYFHIRCADPEGLSNGYC